MKKPLKNAVQAHMEAISLDEQQLEKLLQMQDADDMSNKQRNASAYKTYFSANKPWYVAVAAMVMVFVLGTVVMQYSENMPSEKLIQKIANEVAGNHLAMKPMEVHTAAINDLQSYFTKLDFLPQSSKYIDANDKVLLAGGRYCSIQGSTAAQLRYKNKQGGYVTLFETHYSPEMFEGSGLFSSSGLRQNPELFKQLPDVQKGEKPIVTYAKGIKVTLWQERGLLMVSTEKPD